MCRICALLVFLLFPSIGFSANVVIVVPDDYPGIQQAINSVANGDFATILVKPGTYTENIVIDNIGDRIFRIRSDENGLPQDFELDPLGTIIQAYDSGSTVKFINTNLASDEPWLVGFTIKGGTQDGTGSGIHCDNSSPRISTSWISDNAAYMGGGICCTDHSSPRIENTIICHNEATHGGGITCLEGSSPWVLNVVLFDNEAAARGGGLYCSNGAEQDPCMPVVLNTIFHENLMGTFGKEIALFGASYLTLQYSALPNYSGSNQSWYCQGTSAIDDGDGNDLEQNGYITQQNPLFFNATGDNFHLQKASPCINRGINTFGEGVLPDPIEMLNFDFAMQSRPRVGTVEIGAYEYVGSHHFFTEGYKTDFEFSGDVINFKLAAGVEYADMEYYIIGGATGTLPGSALGSVVIPVNWDAFTDTFIFPLMNTSVLPNFHAYLDSEGNSTAALDYQFKLPEGSGGARMSFAYVVKDPVTHAFVFASNPVEITVVNEPE